MQVVTSVEWQAVKAMYRWQERGGYLEASFSRDGEIFKVVAARQNEMGMTAATATAMRLIFEFRPRYLIMPGIAAGVARAGIKQNYGDVIVADKIWYHGEGKFVKPDEAELKFGSVGFIPRPKSVALLDGLRPYVEAAAAQSEQRVTIGAMTCGHSVVACEEFLQGFIHVKYGDTVGLDMESYPVAYSAAFASEPRPRALVIKSVCDFADSYKSDEYQELAAENSCRFVKLLYEKYLPLA